MFVNDIDYLSLCQVTFSYSHAEDFSGVSIHWTGLLDWNNGLDHWTGIFLVFTHVVVDSYWQGNWKQWKWKQSKPNANEC